MQNKIKLIITIIEDIKKNMPFVKNLNKELHNSLACKFSQINANYEMELNNPTTDGLNRLYNQLSNLNNEIKNDLNNKI